MNESGNYAERTVTTKAEGKFLIRRLQWIGIYTLLVLAYLGSMVKLSSLGGSYGVWVAVVTVPFIPLAAMALRVYTWRRFVAVEYRYEIANAKITFSQPQGKKDKVLYSRLISDFTRIAPVSDEYKEDMDGAGTVLDFRGSPKSPDSYFLRLDENGKKTIVYFEATNKAVKVMKFYNSKGLVMPQNPLRY